MQTLSSLPSLRVRVAVRASWDTQPRLTYNPNAPRKPPKNPNTTLKAKTPQPQTPPTVTLTVPTADLLKRSTGGILLHSVPSFHVFYWVFCCTCSAWLVAKEVEVFCFCGIEI